MRLRFPLLSALCVLPMMTMTANRAVAQAPAGKAAPVADPPSAAEAKMRARLLHAAFTGSLSVMHRDFFRKGESKAIPSQSLEEVFAVMAEEWAVSFRWLADDETALNVDHEARDDFQKKALRGIVDGEKEVMAVEAGELRYAGAVVLRNECLKCHVKDRRSLEDRFAALEIRMAVRP